MNQYPILNFTRDTLTILAGNSTITGSLYLKGAIASDSASTLSGTVTVDEESALNIGGYPTQTFLTEVTSDTFFSSGSTGIGNLGGNINVFGLGSNINTTPASGSGLHFLTQWRGDHGSDQAYNAWVGHTYEDGDPDGLLGPVFVINAATQYTDRANGILLEYRHSDNNMFLGGENYSMPISVRGDGLTLSTDGGSVINPGSDILTIHGNTVYLEGTNIAITGSEYISANLDALPLLGGTTLRMMSYDSASGQVGTSPFPHIGGSETDPIFESVRYTLASTGSNTFTAQQTVNADLVISQSKGLYANLVTENVTNAGIRYYAGTAGHMFTGSVSSFNGFTGSLNGTSSWASSALSANSVAFANVSGKPSLVSGSIQVDVTQTTNYSTLVTTGSNTFIGNQTISGSLIASGSAVTLHSDNLTLRGALNLNATVLTNTAYVGDLSSSPNFFLAAYQPYGGGDMGAGYVRLSALNLDSGSLGNTNVTGSLIVSQSGLNVVGTSNTLGNSSMTGSLTVSGSLSTFNFVSGTLITPTGSFTTPTPSFQASEGQFLFGSGSNGFAMFVWLGGQWRSSSLN
jgi:hypothetical protein